MASNIEFDTSINNEGLKKDLKDTEKLIDQLKRKIESKQLELDIKLNNKVDISKALEEARRELAGTKRWEIGKDGFPTDAKYQMAAQRVAQLEAEMAQTNKDIKKAGADLDEWNTKLEAATQHASDLREHVGDASNKELPKINKSLDGIHKRLGNLLKSVLFFSVITSALRNIRSYLGGVLQQNTELSESIARLKGAFATVAQPLIQAVIPALIQIINLATRAATAIAQLIGAITGKSIGDMQKSAKAMDKVAGAGGRLAKSLASFDTVQKLGQTSGGGGGGAEMGKIYEQTALTNAELAKMLALIAAITAAIIAIKTMAFGEGLLGTLLAIGGAFLYIDGFIDAWANGPNFKNIGEMVLGLSALVAGLAMSFGPVAAAIAAVVGVIGILVVAARDYKSEQDIAFDKREVELYGETVENLTKQMAENRREVENRLIALANEKTETQLAAEAELAATDSIMQKYLELREVQEPTNEQKALMVELSRQLVDMYPELKNYFDGESGLLDISREKWEQIKQAKLEEIKIEAGREKLIEYYKLQYEEEDRLKTAVDNAKKARKEYNDVLDEHPEIKKIKEAEDLTKAIFLGKTSVEELSEADKELWDTLTNGTGIVETAQESINDMIDAHREEYDAVVHAQGNYIDLMNVLAGTKRTYDDVAQQTASFANMLGEQMTQAGKNVTEGYSEAVKNDTSMVESTAAQADSIIGAFKDEMGINSPSKVFAEIGENTVAGFSQGWNAGWKNIIDGLPTLIALLNSGLATELNKLVDTVGVAMNKIINKLNNTGTKINRFTSAVGELSGSSTGISNFKIPWLAQGAVIPPNREFLAVLGDQKAGTNIEAPLDTLVAAFRQVVGEGGQEINVNFTGSMAQFVAMLDKEITISRRNRGV